MHPSISLADEGHLARFVISNPGIDRSSISSDPKSEDLGESRPKRRLRRDAYRALRELPQWDTLLSRLRWGAWGVPALVIWLVSEGVFPENEKENLRRKLYRLKHQVRPDAERHQTALRELAGLAQLFRDQQRRLDVERSMENMIGGLLPGTRSELRILMEILETSAAIKAELGIPLSVTSIAEAEGILENNAQSH